jgi:hypothetical protein
VAKKKKGPSFYRMTISIQTDLKRRMDNVTESVNWSAEAARAFEAKLAEIAQRKEKKTAEDLIQRLRASRLEAQEEAYRDGYLTGRAWVEVHADAKGLQNLANWKERMSRDWLQVYHKLDSQSLARVVTGDDKMDREQAVAFWEAAIGEKTTFYLDMTEFAQGFFDGATDFWAELKDRL